MTSEHIDNPQTAVAIAGAVMAVFFFLIPLLQIVQLCRGTLRAADVSYFVFVMNGTMSVFFFADFRRTDNSIPQIPHALSIISHTHHRENDRHPAEPDVLHRLLNVPAPISLAPLLGRRKPPLRADHAHARTVRSLSPRGRCDRTCAQRFRRPRHSPETCTYTHSARNR